MGEEDREHTNTPEEEGVKTPSKGLNLNRMPKIGRAAMPKIDTPEGFAMLVYSVLDDAMLSHAAKCIFANLVRARKRGTAFTPIGLGLLAKKSQCSISTVRRSRIYSG